MVRIFFLTAGLSLLGACSWSGSGPGGAAWQASNPSSQGFQFDWQLSGDPAVAPMQVFDDGRETWLQFAPGQALPAIFSVGADGERALPYVRRDPYVVLAGAWDGLSFRGGRLMAKAQRAQTLEPKQANGAVQATAEAVAQGRDIAPPAPEPSALPPASDLATAPSTPTASISASVTAPPVTEPSALYRAAPPDATLRAVLARWADRAGWTFHPHHWAVDVDIPLSATAEFPGDFKTAVRGLLGATELADRPLQPCFYGNRVLRVVPIAQSCSRATAPQGAAV